MASPAVKRKAGSHVESTKPTKNSKFVADHDFTPKSVLFTGGAGFIGSNVMLHLIKIWPKATFICLDKLDYCSSVNSFKEVMHLEKFHFVKGDMCSADLVSYIFKTHCIDTVLHFAAQTHVDNSFGNSFSFTESNVMGTHVLLECAKIFKKQLKLFVHVSTDEVYGESTLDDDDVAFDETAALNPSNPYAATKAAAEFLVKAYTTSFNLPCLITRGNNVYGPRQYPEKLIPKFINLLERKRPLTIHGDGSHRRSYLYVGDVAKAFECIVKRGMPGHIYNIGTEFEISNLDTARSLLKAYGLEKEESKYITHVEDRFFNDVRYHIGKSRLEQLGWKPVVPFDEGLKLTIEWYRANKDHWGNVDSALVAHPRVGMQRQDPTIEA